MSEKKYYQVDTKKIKGLNIEAKSYIPVPRIPNLTRAGKSSVQLDALDRANLPNIYLYFKPENVLCNRKNKF